MASFYPEDERDGKRIVRSGGLFRLPSREACRSFWGSGGGLLLLAGLAIPSALVVHFTLARESSQDAAARSNTALEAPGTLLQDAIKIEGRDPARALQLYEQARGDALVIRDFTVAATAMRQAGLLTYRTKADQFEDARQMLSDARQLDLEHRLYENACHDDLALAWLLLERNRPEDRKQAIILYEEVQRFGATVDGIDPLLVSTAEVGVGRQLRDARGDVDGSIKAYTSALGYYRAVRDQGRVLDTEDRLGARYVDQRAYARARVSFQDTATGWAALGDKEWAMLTGATRARRSQLREMLVDMTELEDVYDRLPASSETTVTRNELTPKLEALQARLRRFQADPPSRLPPGDRWNLRLITENVNRMLRTASGLDFEQRLDGLIEEVRPLKNGEGEELANRDRSSEDAFRASYVKALYQWDAGLRDAAVKTARGALDDFFERQFCTIEVLKVRRDRLVALVREADRSFSPVEGCR